MFQAAVMTVSDRSYQGLRPDSAGPAVVQALEAAGYLVAQTALVPDDLEAISSALCRIADSGQIQLLVTTGGTGFSPRDVTPEATLAVCERLTPGIPEAMRYASMAITPRAMLLVTTGGTGFSPRDVTPEATLAVCERLTPGIPEAMRYASMAITPRAMLSRAQAGIRGGTLIVNLPGSPKAALENLEAVLPALEHGLLMLSGAPTDCAASPKL